MDMTVMHVLRVIIGYRVSDHKYNEDVWEEMGITDIRQ
jgi:hypothetical protein